MACVYIATNLINGKRYIGATRRGLSRRMIEHKYSAVTEGKRGVFYRAIRKYGFDMFRFSIVADGLSNEDVAVMEIDLIARLAPEYNMTFGGESLIGLPNIPRTKGTTRIPKNPKYVTCLNDGLVFPTYRLAAKHYGMTGMQVSLSARGKVKSAAGKFFVHCPQDGLPEKIRNSVLEQCVAEKAKKRKWTLTQARIEGMHGVVCVTTGEEYLNSRVAAEAIGVTISAIHKACDGGYCVKKKFLFRWCGKDYVTPKGRVFTDEQRDRLRSLGLENKAKWASYSHLGPAASARAVHCLDDGMVFASASEASRHYGVAKSALIELCLGSKRRKTVGGLKFKYVEVTH